MTGAAIRVVAFDLMDTVLTDPFRAALQAATGRSVAELAAVRDPAMYPALERGEIAEDEYWQHYRDRGIDVDPAAFHRVRRAGIDFVDGMAGLLDGLAGVVERVTASNYPVWIDELADTVLVGRFDQVLGSVHLRARKPDAVFYERLLAAVGVSASELAFVDDRPHNVDAARAAGIASHHFTGAAPLASWLTQIGIPVSELGGSSARQAQSASVPDAPRPSRSTTR